MSSEAFSIVGLVAILLPTLYFLIASPTFLLANFEDPIVTKLFRDLLSFHFKLIGIGSVIGLIAFGIAGHPVFAMFPAIIGMLAILVRRWFLRGMDTEINARDGGDMQAVRRLRHVQWRGMAYNAAQFTALIALIPFVFASQV